MLVARVRTRWPRLAIRNQQPQPAGPFPLASCMLLTGGRTSWLRLLVLDSQSKPSWFCLRQLYY